VRIFHWINALCFVLLLMSGLQIFNSYPRLHWGFIGNHFTPAIFEISGNKDAAHPASWIELGGHRIDTTGFLGKVMPTTFYGVTNVAFPSWTTLPSGPMDLGGGRAWHFLMIWVFFLNAIVFFVFGSLTGHFWRDYFPSREQLQPRAVLSDLWTHLRFERIKGTAALHYNLLQKLAYSLVMFVLMPGMVLSGMTMSPSALAAFPWLLEFFHGRQTARSLHFIIAGLLLLFLIIHLIQIFVAGFVNEMRSIVTGYYAVDEDLHERNTHL
jgi:thiosulfate reductase cytochrome b subunit